MNVLAVTFPADLTANLTDVFSFADSTTNLRHVLNVEMKGHSVSEKIVRSSDLGLGVQSPDSTSDLISTVWTQLKSIPPYAIIIITFEFRR